MLYFLKESPYNYFKFPYLKINDIIVLKYIERKKIMKIKSNSFEETKKIAYDLAINSKEGAVYCLTGDLGVGKTVFAKGFAEGLQIKSDITSPTFTIINIYDGRLPFYHFDVYRINNEYEMEDTGYEDYFYGDGVCLVEWAEIIKNLIPKNALWIKIEKDLSISDNYRIITIEEIEK